MRNEKRSRQTQQQHTPKTVSHLGSKLLGWTINLLTLTLFCILLTACDSSGTKSGKQSGTTTYTDTTTNGKTMEQLLTDYDQQKGQQRISTANKIFGIIYRMELSDSLTAVTQKTNPDSVDALVWYWAGEYFFDTQEYQKGLTYAKRALPLVNRSNDLTQKSDCENIVGLLYVRLSDYTNAIHAVRNKLDIDRKLGDKGRISSSLNTLAGICLMTKQLKDGERYIEEALVNSTQIKDSTRMAIQYGMASEIHHILGKNEQALDDARRAYVIDSTLGNTAKTGIRLSQMASAQMSLGQDAEGERSLKQAIPILEKAGNTLSLSICRNQMGELLNRRGAHAEAADCFAKAANAFAAQKDMYNESRAQLGLYNALKASNPAEAGQHLLRYAQLKDSIYNHDMEQAVSQQNARYKTENLLRLQEKARDAQRLMVVGGIALVAVLLLIVAVLVYSSRIRRRNLLALKRLATLREKFFTNITHEFRTPLTVIIGLSHDLQASGEAEVKDNATMIERQGNNLLTLINQLLNISKMKSAMGDAHWRNGNITAYVTMIVETYRDYARSRDVDLNFIHQETVEMDFVPDYVNKVITNLLSNALKFTPAYGKVSVIVRREGSQLLLEVDDTGKGMDKETLDHVFEPFFQAEDEAQNIGTGIGLALVKQIVDALGGTITAESTPGKGSRFRVLLPISNNVRQKVETGEAPAAPRLSEAVKPLEDSNGGDDACRLLIIEDNCDVAEYIGSQLAATGRYALSYATNGREGLDKALQIVPDLIITDLMMPEMDGLEVCRQVRANDIINHVPIIVVTAKITEEERVKGLKAGADAYLAKPFNADELRTRVEKLLESRRLMRQKFAGIVEGCGKKEDDEENKRLCEADLKFLTRVADVVYTQLNHNKTVSVALVASKMCMSNSQFYRKMIAVTGYTPVAYIQCIRIKKAMKLLAQEPQIALSVVADRCGFDIYPNFVRAFKNVCGITPTEYRKRQEP